MEGARGGGGGGEGGSGLQGNLFGIQQQVCQLPEQLSLNSFKDGMYMPSLCHHRVTITIIIIRCCSCMRHRQS